MTKPWRVALTRVVQISFGLLILAFGYILIVGLGGSAPQFESSTDSLLDRLGKGTTSRHRVNQDRVWISRFSDAQRQQLIQLTPFVNNNDPSCSSQKYCAFSIATEIGGAELVYTTDAPAQLSVTAPWFGGFVNPRSGVLYDLRGRAYLREYLYKSPNTGESFSNLTPYLIQ